ncbi:MAG TPA: VWA domain-containing protein [Candidatus Saccharimonadales bacterium]|nr:VWA domain-containing protein [Candidatus Saccharimonadales bacterium]
MRLRYARWTGQRRLTPEFFKALLRIYNDLLLQTNGDVEEALQWLEQVGKEYGFFDDQFGIQDFRQMLEKSGMIRPAAGGAGYQVTSKGERALRKSALQEIFSTVEKGPSGDHRTPAAGSGQERLSESRPYQFGDRLSDLDVLTTLHNAVKRAGLDDLTLQEEDLAIYENEHLTNCSTVLLVDVSHSMILYGEDRITPAKRVALALAELITTQFPKDSLHVVLFGDDAVEVPLKKLPYITVGPYHTNTRAGLMLAQRILAKERQPNKQIFMITDGKPSCMWESGRLYKNAFGLDPKIVNKTLEQAALCRRKGIEISTFMLAEHHELVGFVDKLTRLNRGRAYFSDLENLGSYVLVDYARNRKRRAR